MLGKQMRFDDVELEIIKGMVTRDGGATLKLLRKVFLPEIDPNAPIGQNIDLWMTMKIEDLEPEQALINLKARNNLIAHVEGCLVQLAALAGNKNETVEETKARLMANSAK